MTGEKLLPNWSVRSSSRRGEVEVKGVYGGIVFKPAASFTFLEYKKSNIISIDFKHGFAYYGCYFPCFFFHFM